MRTALFVSLVLGIGANTTLLGYKIKPIDPKPAREYASHQDFQNIVIGAYPCHTAEQAKEFFDTDKMHEKGIMPVLIVVENNNDFPIGIRESSIFIIHSDRTQVPTVPAHHVVLSLNLNRPLSEIGTRPDILIRQVRNRNMVADFEQKAFGEKLIAPHSSDFGLVFFPLPEEVAGSKLYLPEIYNVAEGEQLIFFEFELMGPEE